MFPTEVKEKALVACSRSCCICHRFCGVKIECHHIVPESEGGVDTFENCIPLCFDCHADVGHYNNKHPKGTKYRSEELKSHRDEWYRKVEAGPIYRPDTESLTVDRNFFLKVRDLLSKDNTINFLRKHDFGGAFPRRYFDNLVDFQYFTDEPENEFLDQRMETIFGSFKSAFFTFYRAFPNRVFVVKGNHEYHGVPEEWLGDPNGEQRFDEAQSTLNKGAGDLVQAYDQFVRDGRKFLICE